MPWPPCWALCLDCVVAEEKEKLKADLDQYDGLGSTFQRDSSAGVRLRRAGKVIRAASAPWRGRAAQLAVLIVFLVARGSGRRSGRFRGASGPGPMDGAAGFQTLAYILGKGMEQVDGNAVFFGPGHHDLAGPISAS
jgi:hypothetical protein